MNAKTIAASVATCSLVFVLFGGGCSSQSNTLSVSDYKTSCTVASDCVRVSIGTVCTPCACADAAINIADQDRYNADFTRVRATCGDVHGCVAACNVKPVSCTAGQCN